MKKFLLMLFATVVGFGGMTYEAEAKRLGGSKSFGSQRDSSVMKRDATPAPAQNTSSATQQSGAAAGAAAQPAKRSWMGPLAGLAAGIGLAALASHLGFGEELASFMMIALLVVGALVLWRMFARRKSPAPQPGMQYAGAAAGRPTYAPPQTQPFDAPAAGGSAATTAPAHIPADFDVAGFLRQAKLNFVRLQAANDAGDVEDIRSFTTPEVFAEIRMQIQERGSEPQSTDVVQVEAVLLDVSTEDTQYVASVRFYGLIREQADASPESFDEVWHLSKPVSGDRGWLIAGIQQME
ncbi:Tim44 domain-containing protein [Methyloversatilis sp.]|uniref:Tim44 domain-containing protein n=1 Tax=Methyloversatilis sp. TaxID=2569862 RepID=UPI003F710325